jgi:large subunit ribosomal protein L24
MKIKKGDTVIVLSGKDRGKQGTVAHAYPKQGTVVVEGVNIVKRHQKARRRRSQGQIIEKPMPVPVSTVGIKDPKTGKPSRVGYRTEGEGAAAKKVRISRQSGNSI